MSSELSILGLYGLYVILTIFAQVIIGTPQVGLSMLVSARDDQPPPTGVTGRMVRAQANSVFALALFAPAVLILAQKAAFTPHTLLAAQIFLIARVLYVPLYASGLPWVRTLTWVVGILATAWLYWIGLMA